MPLAESHPSGASGATGATGASLGAAETAGGLGAPGSGSGSGANANSLGEGPQAGQPNPNLPNPTDLRMAAAQERLNGLLAANGGTVVAASTAAQTFTTPLTSQGGGLDGITPTMLEGATEPGLLPAANSVPGLAATAQAQTQAQTQAEAEAEGYSLYSTDSGEAPITAGGRRNSARCRGRSG